MIDKSANRPKSKGSSPRTPVDETCKCKRPNGDGKYCQCKTWMDAT